MNVCVGLGHRAGTELSGNWRQPELQRSSCDCNSRFFLPHYSALFIIHGGWLHPVTDLVFLILACTSTCVASRFGEGPASEMTRRTDLNLESVAEIISCKISLGQAPSVSTFHLELDDPIGC